MRRGYSPGLYSPSRNNRQSSPTNSVYRPVPKKNTSTKYPSNRPRTNPYRTQPIRAEPNIEQMIERLKKTLDGELLDRVLDKLEAEFDQMWNKVKEVETGLENLDKAAEIKTPEITDLKPHSRKAIESDEYNLESGDKIENSQEENESNPNETELKELEEQKDSEDDLFEIDDEFDWLRDQIEDGLPNIETTEPAIEETPFDAIDLIAEQPIKTPAMESSEIENDIEENPMDYSIEPLEDLEPILDQIEPYQLSLLEPIEEMFPLDEVLPEDIEEPLDELGVEVY